MYIAVRLQFASSSVASSHAGNYCGELVQKRLVAWENQKPEIKVHTCGTRRHSSYILWPRLVANLQQKHQLKNRMKGFHAAALACLALAHAIAPPGGEALVDGEIARGRERDQDGNFFDGGPCTSEHNNGEKHRHHLHTWARRYRLFKKSLRKRNLWPKMSSQEVAAYVAVAVAAAGAIVRVLRGRRGKTYPEDDKYP